MVTKFILDKEDSEDDFYPSIVEHPYYKATTTYYYNIKESSTELSLLFSWPPLDSRVFRTYSPGTYRAYIYLAPDGIILPPGLEEQLSNCSEFGTQYIHYPISGNSVTFQVED